MQIGEATEVAEVHSATAANQKLAVGWFLPAVVLGINNQNGTGNSFVTYVLGHKQGVSANSIRQADSRVTRDEGGSPAGQALFIGQGRSRRASTG